MAQTTGVVYKVFTKVFPGKGGKPGNTWFSIKLEENETYFRCKGSNPGDIAGKTVRIQHDEVKDGQANVLSAPVIVDEAPPAKTPSGSASVGATGATGATLGQAREASIHYQSARKDALQFVDIATRLGAVKLPAKETNKLEALEALVDSYTSAYFSDISSFGAVARASGKDTEGGAEAPVTQDEEE